MPKLILQQHIDLARSPIRILFSKFEYFSYSIPFCIYKAIYGPIKSVNYVPSLYTMASNVSGDTRRASR